MTGVVVIHPSAPVDEGLSERNLVTHTYGSDLRWSSALSIEPANGQIIKMYYQRSILILLI
jgi:hypothetical protein